MIKKVINDANEERLKVIKRMALIKQYDEEYAIRMSKNITTRIDKEIWDKERETNSTQELKMGITFHL